jgi:hypothetical protein
VTPTEHDFDCDVDQFPATSTTGNRRALCYCHARPPQTPSVARYSRGLTFASREAKLHMSNATYRIGMWLETKPE